ncbi:MAG TPA: bifunctional ornithine acetyltransferase/N-acetylglutamate synthase, partial [Ktedonobacteraceae bacterium]|nr:bifunctional ornithine acetyltransferase/N-acetylglutamate synthase [Ktedonobacteraceae bacterium]
MSHIFHEIDGCVTAPQGFRAGTTACGIKSDGAIQDLAILASDMPCIAYGMFTPSSTRAAPVQVCQEHLKSGKSQAVIVNSGNANCATGDVGLFNAYRMTELVAAKLQLENDMVLCSSTGIIGRHLPIDKIEAGVAKIELRADGGNAFSEAIMTTDTRPKRIALEFSIDGKTIRLGG